jgi:hypothetical protein
LTFSGLPGLISKKRELFITAAVKFSNFINFSEVKVVKNYLQASIIESPKMQL